MEKVIEIIKNIKNTTSTNEKVQILQYNSNNEMLKTILELTYNPYLQFGVKKLPNALSFEFNFDEFVEIAYECANKEGNLSKRQKYQLTLAMGRDEIRQLLEKVINKDLECGINIGLINKSNIIHIDEFGVMLAKPTQYLDKFIENNEKFYSNPKYDGVRAICKVKQDGSMIFYSRNGKIYDNFYYLKPFIQQSIPENSELILDGEITHNDFQELMTITKRKNNIHVDFKGLTYNVFDIITPQPLNERKDLLKSIITPNEHVKIVDYRILKTKQQVLDELDYQIEEGYEGLVLKNPNSYYEYGKSNDWVKVKKMDTYDATIVNLLEGTGKYKNMLGKFEIELENGKKQFCGSGLSDEDRLTFWNNKDKLIGKTIELKYQDITKDGLLRFPIYVQIRDDK